MKRELGIARCGLACCLYSETVNIQNYLGFATSQSIYHWFAGRNMPSIDNLYALSELFGVPVDEMLTGSRKICFCFNRDLFWERAQMYYEKVQ